MRRVDTREALPEALQAAMREADAAFGDPTMFLEQAVLRPRHIEVQILADAEGNVMHLFERDCSIQRRHQKVIEIAPAPNLDEGIRQALYRDAVKFAKALNYVNAGTVEFLVDTVGERAGQHVFIEMNPRIQVEHTVTEEVTDVDLVQAQLRIAAGESLADLGLSQESVQLKGAALQCRITTEDPANGFRPDVGKITGYRSAGGAGVRLDGGTVYSGAEISPHFDSMLVKLTCRGRNYPAAVARARRALAEFRIRGVSTNISFLQAVLDDPDFVAGDVATSFIDERPQLLKARVSADRGTKLLTWLADVTVNKPNGELKVHTDPADKLPALDDAAARPGSRQRLQELGPEGFARALRAQDAVAVTDTTFRDAHQSLLATRVRTRDLVAAGPAESKLLPELLSVEAWGGATYDVALRFLGEDPWDRLAALRKAMPNLCLQMLLRGRNTVGYTPYPEEVTVAFVNEAAATGIDIFRIFDALNDVNQMAPAIRAVRETGTAVAEVALCYTADMLDPEETLYTLDYYLELAQKIVDAGAHILAIKDMAGLLRPAAAARLVSALRERFDLPVHLHTHDTAGGQLATLLAAVDAGVDAVDVASASLAGTTSQPSASALVAALAHTPRDTGLSLANVCALEPYWEAVRRVYAPFESGLPGPTGRVYQHEIPGGQLSNLRQQAMALGLGERFEAIEDMYTAADRILGRLVKVTPSSKVVGDLALHLVGLNADPADFNENPQKYDIPDSVIGFLSGELGDPPGGWPEPFRTKALQGRTRQGPRRRAQRRGQRRAQRRFQDPCSGTLNRLLFAGPTKDYQKSVEILRQPFGAGHARLPLRAAARRGARDRAREGRPPDRLARGRLRAGREGHAHGHVHAQRPVPARGGPRPFSGEQRQGRRTRRHLPAGPGRLAVRRCRHADRQGRGHRQGRRHGGHDRGHEDGGVHHDAGGRHRRAPRRRRRSNRSRAGICCSSSNSGSAATPHPSKTEGSFRLPPEGPFCFCRALPPERKQRGARYGPSGGAGWAVSDPALLCAGCSGAGRSRLQPRRGWDAWRCTFPRSRSRSP